jgi:lipoyl(octanoyl) transferase
MGTVRVVIESEPQDGVRNMAVDEALLEAALERGQCAVRWYRWSGPTVSLGYFQPAEAAETIPGLAGLPIVRRLTGGGAILHHHEWTYSCAVPPGNPLAENPPQIYDRVHEQIMAALAEQGIRSTLRGEALAEREGTFLCFGRGDPRDIVLAGHKILGSAQRRRRGAVLQHGSLLLHRSEHAPQFPGLVDLEPDRRGLDAAINFEFVSALGAAIGALFGDVASSGDYPTAVEERVNALLPKYRELTWSRRESGRADESGGIGGLSASVPQ